MQIVFTHWKRVYSLEILKLSNKWFSISFFNRCFIAVRTALLNPNRRRIPDPTLRPAEIIKFFTFLWLLLSARAYLSYCLSNWITGWMALDSFEANLSGFKDLISVSIRNVNKVSLGLFVLISLVYLWIYNC